MKSLYSYVGTWILTQLWQAIPHFVGHLVSKPDSPAQTENSLEPKMTLCLTIKSKWPEHNLMAINCLLYRTFNSQPMSLDRVYLTRWQCDILRHSGSINAVECSEHIESKGFVCSDTADGKMITQHNATEGLSTDQGIFKTVKSFKLWLNCNHWGRFVINV